MIDLKNSFKKNKFFFLSVLIYGVIAFVGCTEEEKVVVKYIDRPTSDSTNKELDLSGVYIGRTILKQYRNDGGQIGLWSSTDSFLVTRYPYNGDSVFVVGFYPDTIHLKVLSNGLFNRVNEWNSNEDKSKWSDAERFEVKNDTLFRDWFTQKIDSNGKKTRWEGVGVYPKM